MESWIYLFSQFTPEALVLESALIFILCGGYAIFWILRKRKFGVVDKALPSGPVKAYLNELIGNADNLRTQLFGLLSENDKQSSLANNSDLGKILSNLELKLDAQGKAIGNLSANGVPVATKAPETVLSAIDAVGAPDSAEYNSLKDKVNHLETRLAEYSIIEDDLANLKRIQQENAELRATLMGRNGGAMPASVPQAAPAATPEPKAAVVPEPSAAGVPAGDAAPKAAPAEAAPKKAPAPAAEPARATDMGEDDLIKEFEKMLQG
ncbi:MAG: hypothetical protein ABIQ95_16975 [Bdellovibrionia bacterium]